MVVVQLGTSFVVERARGALDGRRHAVIIDGAETGLDAAVIAVMKNHLRAERVAVCHLNRETGRNQIGLDFVAVCARACEGERDLEWVDA